jgi:hypothetical protein
MTLPSLLRKLAFLAVSASLFGYFSAVAFVPAAQASSREMALVADIAGLHCKLWLSQIQGKNAPLSADELSLLLKRPISQEEAEEFRYRFKGLPDFGFMLRRDWAMASRADRQNFNFYTLQWLKREYELAGNDGEACTFSLSLTELPEDAPQPIDPIPGGDSLRFRAIARTVLPSMQGPVSVAYELQQGRLGWQITEIFINEKGLYRENYAEFADHLAQGGYRELIRALINRG